MMCGCFFKLIEHEEICFSFFVIVQQVYRLQAFLQVVYHIIIKVRLQYIFYSSTVLFLYINNIREQRCAIIPALVFVQKFYTLRVTFHRIYQALKQVVFIFSGIQFPAFFCKIIAQAFHHILRLQNLLFGKLVLILQLLQVCFFIFQFSFFFFFICFQLLQLCLTLGFFFLYLHNGALQVLDRCICNSYFFFCIKLVALNGLVFSAHGINTAAFIIKHTAFIFYCIFKILQFFFQLFQLCGFIIYLCAGKCNAFFQAFCLALRFLQKFIQPQFSFF